jgi:hypothetical protein
MKKTNVIFFVFTLLIFIIISGCSATYQVASYAVETNHEIITKEAFIEKVRDKNVTITLKTGQLVSSKVQSLQGDILSLIKGHDTLDIQITDIKFISDEHRVIGAIVGLPLGTLLGGLVGGTMGQTASGSGEQKAWSGFGGFVYGSAIGLVVGTTVGIFVPPTTYYEFGSINEIYEKRHAP